MIICYARCIGKQKAIRYGLIMHAVAVPQNVKGSEWNTITDAFLNLDENEMLHNKTKLKLFRESAGFERAGVATHCGTRWDCNTHTMWEQAVFVRNPTGAGLRK